MTWQFDVNNATVANRDHTGLILTKLTDLMETHVTHAIVGAGDGQAHFENEGDTAGPYNFLSYGTGVWANAVADDISNPQAWLRIRETGTTREWIFSRYTSVGTGFSHYLCVAFSATGFVSTGTASATVPPTQPADVQYLWGTGYGVGAGATWGPMYAVAQHTHVAVNDAKVNGVHAFYTLGRLAGTKLASHGWIMDPLNNGMVGDTQPWVSWMPAAMSSGFISAQVDLELSGYHDYGGGSEAWYSGRTSVGFGAQQIKANDNGFVVPGFIAPQVDGFSRAFAPVIGRRLDGIYRGISSAVRWKGTDARDYPSTAFLATVDGAYVYVDKVMLRWPTGVVPL